MMGHWFSALDFLAVEPSPYIIGNRYATLFTKRSGMPQESHVPIGVSNVNSTRLDASCALYDDRRSPVAYESVSGIHVDLLGYQVPLSLHPAQLGFTPMGYWIPLGDKKPRLVGTPGQPSTVRPINRGVRTRLVRSLCTYFWPY